MRRDLLLSIALAAVALSSVVPVTAAFPSVARAQTETCVMLPSPSTTAPESAREQVQAIVTEELREHGNVVLGPRDAQLRMMGQSVRDCAAIDCAAAVNRFLGTGFAVLTEIAWVGGRITMVNVALIGLEDGESVGGQAEVVAGDVAAATRAAFTAAWDRWAAAQQGYIVVTTTPPGAFVELDGASLGRSPIRRLTRSGVHTLRATLEGYRSVTREITIDRHEEREIAITLTPGEGEDPTHGGGGSAAGDVIGGEQQTTLPPVETRDEPHWSNFLIGGGLIAAGLGALISPVWTLAVEGDAWGDEGTEYVSFGAQSGVLMGVGIAAIVGGAVVMIVQPVTTTVTVSPTSAGIQVSGRF
ncbi:PEGA domain-containing protein [Sandaracinus amylolyticus]|uniref:PEGA domain-containing protein n=1 Tax=Sandaracinus amylolyticus TaxID=927083 RepID=A0A0F6YIT5_9BACT|nr:PEGA domain-containing protein [Sandaracinus amylolyticus]AKF06545.1 hypothetical protein DB32_003694 [Sandaracinus amylolyticus]